MNGIVLVFYYCIGKKIAHSGVVKKSRTEHFCSIRLGTGVFEELPLESTENGTDDSPEIGTYESTVFGTVTRNKNKEIEQGSSFPAQALLLTIPTDPKPKRSRAKPKTSCPFSSGDAIPPAYLEYAKQKHPSIDAQAEFTKFVDFHLSKDNRYCDWYAAWRTWATNAEEYARKRAPSYRPAYGGFREKHQCDRVYDPDDPV